MKEFFNFCFLATFLIRFSLITNDKRSGEVSSDDQNNKNRAPSRLGLLHEFTMRYGAGEREKEREVCYQKIDNTVARCRDM